MESYAQSRETRVACMENLLVVYACMQRCWIICLHPNKTAARVESHSIKQARYAEADDG